MAKKTLDVVVKSGRTVVTGEPQKDAEGKPARPKTTNHGPGAELTLDEGEALRLIDIGAVARRGSDEATAAKANADQIPDNFPGQVALAKAGIETFSALKSYEGDLVELEDIGEATAEKIAAALEELEAE